MANIVHHSFDDRPTAANELALSVAENLRDGITMRGAGLLAVSGGTTPEQFMAALSSQKLDWSSVVVTLVDDRWVPPTDERSNERLVRRLLLQNDAEKATFVPLYTSASDPDLVWTHIEKRIAALNLPFDALVLGLGPDGHCASLFPDGDRFDEGIDPDGTHLTIPMRSEAAGEPRISLTLPAIISTRNLYLQIDGQAKRDVLDRIETGADEMLAHSPLKSIVEHSSVALNVYWSA